MSLCLLTEGTYPYHVGGVSTWTHALLQGLSDVPVLLVPLYAGQPPGAPLWDLPAHVTAHPPLRVPDTLAPDAIADWCRTVAPTLPAMDLVHALTAGVAGQLGRRLQTERGLPFLVTEHGIGWHELQQGAGETETGYRPEGAAPCAADAALKRAVRDLQHHARAVYTAADALTTVAWANQKKQYALGADPARCHVVPNGVSVPNRPPDDPTGPFHVGLVGRVTPLKDIVTFLHACALVHEVLPTARFSVVGPPSDPAYAARCHALAHRLDLDDAVTFVEDARTMPPWYRRFHAVALTSRSEARRLSGRQCARLRRCAPHTGPRAESRTDPWTGRLDPRPALVPAGRLHRGLPAPLPLPSFLSPCCFGLLLCLTPLSPFFSKPKARTPTPEGA